MSHGDDKRGPAVSAKDGSKTSRGSSETDEIEKDRQRAMMGQAPLMGIDMDPSGGLKELKNLRKVMLDQDGNKASINADTGHSWTRMSLRSRIKTTTLIDISQHTSRKFYGGKCMSQTSRSAISNYIAMPRVPSGHYGGSVLLAAS